MPTNAGTAFIQIKGDFGPLRAGLRRAESTYSKQVEGIGTRLSNSLKVAARIGGAALAAGAVIGAKKSVDAAVDLGEQINKTKVVFQGAEEDVLSFGEQTSKSLGISNRAALEAAGIFGNMIVPMGIARKDAAKMSVDMVRLAADMASFNNASPEETLDAIRSGLAGQSEPLRRFGVDLRETALQEFALGEGIKKSVKEMSNAEKAQLAYGKILNDTKDAQGDFARTSDSLANQQRTLRAQFEDIGASLGKALLPALQKGASAVSDFLTDTQKILSRRDLTAGEKFDRIGDEIAERLEAALPVVAEAAAKIAPKIASALFKGFVQAPALVQLVAGAWVFAKSRKLLTAFGLLGTQAGAAFSAGAATTAGVGGVAAGAVGGGAAGGLVAGAAGGALGGAAAAKHTKALELVFGKGARSGAPISQLGPKVGGLATLAEKLKGFAKTGVWTAVGVVAADTVLKGLEDRMDRGSSDLRERLKSLATYADLEEVGDTFTLRGGRQEKEVEPAKRLLKILDEVKNSRRGITAEAAAEATQLAKNLDLTRQQRAEIRGLLEASQRKPVVASLDIVRQLEEAKNLTPTLINQIADGLKGLPEKSRRHFAQVILTGAAELKKKGQLKGSLDQLKQVIEAEVGGVGRLSVRGPARLRERLGAVFQGMVAVVADPTSRMARIVQTYLDAFGIGGGGKLAAAINHSKALNKSYKFDRSPGQAGFAKGGILSGSGRKDTVPVMAAPGEAFLTRHQQVPVDRALRTTYGFGLSDLFKREKKPHSFAQGGFVEFQKGGKVPGGIVPIPGQPGEFIHSSILKDVQALIKRYKLRVTDGYAPSGHAAGGEHPKGLAIDAVPGAGGSWNLIDKLASWAEPQQGSPRAPFRWVGYTGDAGHGRGDHLHLSWGGGTGVGAIDVPDLGQIVISGRSGAPKELAQAAVSKTRKAAQRFLDRQADAGAPTGTEADPGEGAVGSGAGLMRRISKQRGWNFGHWWKLDEKETGHGRNLVNPDSTARLRGQFLDMNYGKYGPGSDPGQSPSMAQQIRSMARYIAERYGNPTRALAFHNKNNYYERGGFVDDFIPFFQAGGDVEVAAAKKPPKGLKKPPKGKRHELKPKRGKTKSRLPHALLPELGFINYLRKNIDETIPRIEEKVAALDEEFGLSEPEFYPDERVVARLQREGHNVQKLGDSFIDWTAVGQRKSELGRLLGESYQLIGTPFGAPKGWMEIVKDAFVPAQEALQRFIARLKEEMAAIKRKVRKNTKEINRLDNRIEREQGKKKPDRDKIEGWDKERRELADENRRLTGQRTPADLDNIREGRLGRVQERLEGTDETRPGALQTLGLLEDDRKNLVGLTGAGGNFGSKKVEIQGLVNELGELSTERITEAVAPVKPEESQFSQDVKALTTALSELFKQYGSNIRPLKAFAKGGIAKGLALVGEKGYELAKLPGGKLEVLGQQGPEIRELPGGTRVYSHPETKRKLGTDGGRESPGVIPSVALQSLSGPRFSERFTSQTRITEKLKIPAFAQGGIVKPFAQGGVIEPPQATVQDGQVVLDPRQLKLLIDELRNAKKEVNIDARPQFKEQKGDPHQYAKALEFAVRESM